MKRPTDAAHQWMFSGLFLVLLPLACSTDRRGLGELDGGGSSGGRVGTASGGQVGTGTGGAATGGRMGEGSGGTASGGRDGTGGANTGGAATGGRGTGGANTGGAATGGRGTGGANTGGAATGGRGTGGANTGGANTGGAATGGRGTGGAGTGGRGTGGAGTGGRGTEPQPDCTRDSDCHLVEDCCTCAAFGPNQDPPTVCGLVCVQSKCMALHLPRNQVACVAGRCVAGFNCDSSTVTCRTAPPDCPAGQVPGVNADGRCYTGSCIPSTQCTYVDDCAVCSSTQGCVTNEARGGHDHHCVTIPASCDGKGACSCLGETTCLAPYSSCNNGPGQDSVTCGCPTC